MNSLGRITYSWALAYRRWHDRSLTVPALILIILKKRMILRMVRTILNIILFFRERIVFLGRGSKVIKLTPLIIIIITYNNHFFSAFNIILATTWNLSFSPYICFSFGFPFPSSLLLQCWYGRPLILKLNDFWKRFGDNFAILHWCGKRDLYTKNLCSRWINLVKLSTLMLPGTVTLIPTFLIAHKLGLEKT